MLAKREESIYAISASAHCAAWPAFVIRCNALRFDCTLQKMRLTALVLAYRQGCRPRRYWVALKFVVRVSRKRNPQINKASSRADPQTNEAGSSADPRGSNDPPYRAAGRAGVGLQAGAIAVRSS